jgi:2'-5' RNA ligase
MGKTDRLFFALYPDSETAAQIVAFATAFLAENQLKGRAAAPERLHVTLAFLGDHDGVPKNLVSRAKAAADQVTLQPFTCAFDRVMNFKRDDRGGPLVLLTAGDGLLFELQARLAAALAREHIHLPERNFTPHITLAYDAVEVEEQPAGRYSWQVNAFQLMHSFIGQSRHAPLGRWPLSGERS